MRGGVRRVHLIERINQAAAKQPCPQAIDNVACEEAIVLGPQGDFDEFLARAEGRFLRQRRIVVFHLLLDDLFQFFQLFR